MTKEAKNMIRLISTGAIIGGLYATASFGKKEKALTDTSAKYRASVGKIISIVVVTAGVVSLASSFLKSQQ